MSVRRRKWTTRKGEERDAWIVDYSDQSGERHIETFERKKDADARHAEVKVDVKAGVHVATSKSITVREAGANWIKTAEAHLERATTKGYREHLDRHIVPYIGSVKLSEITAPTIRAFEDKLRDKLSASMVRKVMVSLGALLGDAHESGLVARNAVRDLRRNRKRGRDRQAELRKTAKVQVGVDIPSPLEMSAILNHVAGRYRAFIVTATFTGLRASELRGLRWEDLDLKHHELHVRQRADRFYEIGAPKSAAARRKVPLGEFVANTLKEWKLQSKSELVFANTRGGIIDHANAVRDGLIPSQIKAGIVGKDGKAKYTGFHALRHFYASWCINSPADGGLGLPPKVVQERMGHSSITVTLDTYGHLFPRGEDAKELGKAERALMALSATHGQHRA